MSIPLKLKTLGAAIALGAAGAASASPIYLDNGIDYGSIGMVNGKVTATSTSLKNEVTYLYQSTTVITDLDGNGIDAGDAVSTSIGLFGGNDLSENVVTGFNPSQTFGSNSDNGYGLNWLLSFSVEGYQGMVSSLNGQIPLIAYGPGIIDMLLTFDGATFINFMDLAVGGAGANGVATVLFGTPDWTTVDGTYNNLFHSGTASCGGSSGFKDLTECAPPVKISFLSSQDTNVTLDDFTLIGQDEFGNDLYETSTNHDGSIAFFVPEPASVALFGLALLGLGAARRRKA